MCFEYQIVMNTGLFPIEHPLVTWVGFERVFVGRAKMVTEILVVSMAYACVLVLSPWVLMVDFVEGMRKGCNPLLVWHALLWESSKSRFSTWVVGIFFVVGNDGLIGMQSHRSNCFGKDRDTNYCLALLCLGLSFTLALLRPRFVFFSSFSFPLLPFSPTTSGLAFLLFILLFPFLLHLILPFFLLLLLLLLLFLLLLLPHLLLFFLFPLPLPSSSPPSSPLLSSSSFPENHMARPRRSPPQLC